MSGRTIGVVAAVVVVLGAAYYFLPMMQATAPAVPAGQEQAVGTEQSGTNLAGTWRSESDAKFTREIRTDGVIIDRYEGDVGAGVGGSWSVVNPALEAPLAARAASLAGRVVIKASWENDSVVTYFAVNTLSENSMTITDLSGRGEVTTFVKI